jgi:hypothetical protein
MGFPCASVISLCILQIKKNWESVLLIPTREKREYLTRTDNLRKKARISIAIDKEFLVWIDQMIDRGVFANRSHAIHRALLKLKEEAAN